MLEIARYLELRLYTYTRGMKAVLARTSGKYLLVLKRNLEGTLEEIKKEADAKGADRIILSDGSEISTLMRQKRTGGSWTVAESPKRGD